MTREAAPPGPPARGSNQLTVPAHPAKYSPNVLSTMRAAIAMSGVRGNVLDPFGGVGGIHELQGPGVDTWCIEMEHEWAHQAGKLGWVWCGDFFEFEPANASFITWDEDGSDFAMPPSTFDVIATSPTYGNRMADHHNARDGSTRITYKHRLGRDLSPNNSGAMQFGDEYKAFHIRAYKRFRTLLRPGGMVLLNVSDFQRKGEMLAASEWHDGRMRAAGFTHVKTYNVPTPRMGYGKNGTARAEFEQLHVYRWQP